MSKQYEYWIEHSTGDKTLISYLDGMGALGWELVYMENHKSMIFIFKREIDD